MDENYINSIYLFTIFALDDERDITNLIFLTPIFQTFFVHLGYPYFPWYALLNMNNKNTAELLISGVHPDVRSPALSSDGARQRV